MKMKLITIFLLSWQLSLSQSLYKSAEAYFPGNPFKTTFNKFLYSLINDPLLLEKEVKKKTDTTLFYLQGIYPSYSPFFFPSTRCKIILAEQEEYTDSLAAETYNYFVYQLIGFAKPGEEGQKDIKEEFEKLKRRFKKGLELAGEKELKRGNEQSGSIINYIYKEMPFYPLTIAWVSSADHTENIIALTIRFFINDNKAYLPISPDSP